MQLTGRTVSARAGELWTVWPGGVVDVWNGTAWTTSDVMGGPTLSATNHVVLATPGAVWLGWNLDGGGIMRLPR
jgi:hypothetical protein